MNWANEVVLLTGGTGSLGRAFAELIVRRYHPKQLVIFSRDECKQQEMRAAGLDERSGLRYVIGDVRDSAAVRRACKAVTMVVHAAALKQVGVCESNPFEAIQTNILGSRNVIDAAADQGVKTVLAVSTDKAVNPINVYGATKFCAEKMFVQANGEAAGCTTRFSCVRFGNFVGSRGSLIPVLMEQRKRGKITLTDARMTRFWVTLEQAVQFTLLCIAQMRGGEIFLPKCPSMRVLEVAKAVAPGCEIDYIGVRPGEKLHEALLSEEEARRTLDVGEMYVIQPDGPWWRADHWPKATALPADFRYTSDSNHTWMTGSDLAEITLSECSATHEGEGTYLVS